MIKKIIVLTLLGVSLTGCFMGPMALVGPAASGFSTASLVQSGISSSASYIIKKSTGKSLTEHVIGSVSKESEIKKSLLKFFDEDGPVMLEIKVNKGARSDLGRPTTSPIENRDSFMRNLNRFDS